MNTSMTQAREVRSGEEPSPRLTLRKKLALLYTASVPFDGLLISGGRSLPFIVGSVYLTVTILSRLMSERGVGKDELPIRPILPAMVFTFYCASSYYWSLAPDLTITRLATLLFLLLISWFLSQDLSRIGRAVPIAFALGSVPVALFVLAAPPLTDDRRTANGNANNVAVILLLGVACALWMSLSCRGKVRFLGLATIPILIIGTVATGSRTTVLGGAAMLLIVVGWFAWKLQWQRVVILLALVALSAWIFPHVPTTMVPDRLRSIQEALQGNLSNRTYIWDAILNRGLDLTGVGAGASPAYLGEAIGSQSVSHNVFLGVLLDTGILGLVSFLVVLVKATIDARRSPHKELLVFMLPVMVAGSMTLSMEASRPLWFVIALAWVAQPDEPGFGSIHLKTGVARAIGGVR
jgi:O-antigen ligase